MGKCKRATVPGLPAEGLLPDVNPRESAAPAKEGVEGGGLGKGGRAGEAGAQDRQAFDCATWLHKARALPKEESQQAVEPGNSPGI